MDSSGSLAVFQDEGAASSHISDLFVISRQESQWTGPRVLTGQSPFAWQQNPAISDDGSKVLFQCGASITDGHSICEVGTDGTGFRVVLTPEDSPPGAPDTGHLQTPDYAPDGSIVFTANWDGEGVWRLNTGATEPVLVRANLRSPCVLSDGRIAAVAQEPSGDGDDDLRIGVLDADGSSFVTLVTVEKGGSVAGGLGCGG